MGVLGVLRIWLILRVETDLKFCTIAAIDPGWVPHGCIVQNQNPVNMIWHDNKLIQGQIQKMARQGLPDRSHPLPQFIQPHFPIHHLSKPTDPIACTNGNEIGSWGGIIVSFEANRSSMVNIRVVLHGIPIALSDSEFPFSGRSSNSIGIVREKQFDSHKKQFDSHKYERNVKQIELIFYPFLSELVKILP
jgi:hypothetical protein